MKDLTEKRYGKLVAKEKIDERAITSKSKRIIWKCMCDCGNYCYISTKKWGVVKSCGCLLLNPETIKHANKGLLRIDGTELTKFLSDKIPSNNTSGVKGVKKTIYKSGTIKYIAGITISGKRKELGCYNNLEDAKKRESKLF